MIKNDNIMWITIYKKNEKLIAKDIKIFYYSWNIKTFWNCRYNILNNILEIKPLIRNILNETFSLKWYKETLNLKTKEIYLLNLNKWR